MKTTERFDPELAAKDACRHPRPAGVLPHHLRCDWIRGDFDAPGPKQRCRLGDNHPGEHEYE